MEVLVAVVVLVVVCIGSIRRLLPSCDTSSWSITAFVPTASDFSLVSDWSAEVLFQHLLECHVTRSFELRRLAGHPMFLRVC